MKERTPVSRRKILLLFFSALLSGAAGILSTPGPLVISEIMFNPNGDENAREFVEIVNISGNPVSLEGFRIGDGAAFDAINAAQEGKWTILSRGYALIMDPDYFTAGELYSGIPEDIPIFVIADKAIGSRGLSNSNPEPLYLISASGDTLSMVRYSAGCPPGHSWERVIPWGEDSPENFRPSREIDGTPGRSNSVTPPERNPALLPSSLRWEPEFPRMGENVNFFVSCRNAGLAPLSGARASVRMLPDIPLGTVLFEEDIPPGEDAQAAMLHCRSIPGGLLTVEVILEGEMSACEDDTLQIHLSALIPPGTIILNEIMAAPREGPEWIELMNTGTAPASILGWKVCDSRRVPSEGAQSNAFIPPGGYAIISAGELLPSLPGDAPQISIKGFPALNNDGDLACLIDYSDSPADSAVFTSTATGYSLELISPRLRGSAGAWDLCTAAAGSTPGARNSIFFSHAGVDGTPGGAPGLIITPNPFSDITTISYNLPFPLARVRLTVYDRRGRFVAAVREAAESGSIWTGEWDSRSSGRPLPVGPYILCFEALNKNTGEMVTIRKAIVRAKKL